jgi:hypothetical protein
MQFLCFVAERIRRQQMKMSSIVNGMAVLAAMAVLGTTPACGVTPTGQPQATLTVVSSEARTAAPVQETETPEKLTPSPTATTAFTPTPAPQLEKYLLSINDLPADFYPIQESIEVSMQDNNYVYSTSFRKPDYSVTIRNLLNVSIAPVQPGALVLDWEGFTRVNAAEIGQGSIAYQGQSFGLPVVAQLFYKGNSLVRVSITGAGNETTIGNVVQLARIVENRLPETLPVPAPFIFPSETIDQTTLDMYFNSVKLAEQEPGKTQVIPAENVSPDKFVCFLLDATRPTPQYTAAIYNEQSKLYMSKITFLRGAPVGVSSQCMGLWSQGGYRLRLWVGDAMVADIPYEVK